MTTIWYRFIILIMLFSSVAYGQDGEESLIHTISFKHLKTSLRHELGVTFGAHVFRSPQVETFYTVRDGIALPEPVFNRGIGIASMSYEPRLRILEIGSEVSISLDVPLVASLSTVDVRTADGIHFNSAEVTEQEMQSGVYHRERSSALGAFHVEAGGMLSLNMFQGATYENTKNLGLSLSAGLNYIVAPLRMNRREEYDREDYEDMLSWVTPVGRLGVHIRGIAFYYTIGINPTRVIYPTLNSKRATFTNSYNRFSIALRIGR